MFHCLKTNGIRVMKKTYVKHIVECNCVLPQFQNRHPVIFHKFVVFSVIEEDKFLPSFAQCNNCSGVHHVTEVNESRLVAKENTRNLPDEEEIKASLSTRLVGLIEKYKPELPTLQEIAFIFQEEMWGSIVVLSKEKEGNTVFGKTLMIAGPELFKIDSFLEEIVTTI